MKIALLLLAAVSSVAPAQVPRAPVLAEFGQCIARQASGVAQALLATEMGSRQEFLRAQQLFNASPACYRDREGLSARVGEVRGIVAEALLEADAAAMARLSARPLAPPVRASVGLDGRAFVAAYAACLADADPARSVALMAAPHRSQAELGAFMAYGDTLNACMPEGLSYRIDRFDVRNHIAAHLYKRAMEAEAMR